MNCPQCHHLLSDGRESCGHCGAKRVIITKPFNNDRDPAAVTGKSGTYHYTGRAGYLGNAHASQTKEVTLGTWDDHSPELKLDIRWWKGNEYQKGISLTEKEVRDLRRILDSVEFGK